MYIDMVICLTDDGSITDTIREIKEMTNQDNRLYVSVLAEDISSLENYFHNATVIVMVLTVLVSLFSFINLLNTSITNVIRNANCWKTKKYRQFWKKITG